MKGDIPHMKRKPTTHADEAYGTWREELLHMKRKPMVFENNLYFIAHEEETFCA
jgi:hypothetical protein